MASIRLTAAQALVRYLQAQMVETDSGVIPYFAGAWAIFGHGNVSALGEALYEVRESLPTYRAHNEQSMAHAAIAFAKASRRRRSMVCTTSIGPGATNMVTAAALAHVNRLPVLFLPGDVFASRRPDPVLQQIEAQQDGAISANDCFRPVSNYFDRITRPEQLLNALPRAMATMMDPASCGPVTLALCQDTQAEAYDFPADVFKEKVWKFRRPRADNEELSQLVQELEASKKPLIVAGGGVLYSGAESTLAAFAESKGIPVAETQAGKSSLSHDHQCNLGAIGVTGSSAANAAAREADLIIGVGTRLQDFTTGSKSLLGKLGQKLVHINISAFDARKHMGIPVVGDAGATLDALSSLVRSYAVSAEWKAQCAAWRDDWRLSAAQATRDDGSNVPSDAQVIGAVNRSAERGDVVVCAAGGLPGELHKLWRSEAAGGYHVEYGYSCMGYEIAGGLGVKMAVGAPNVFVMVGDGSYLMANSEIATSILLGQKLTIIVLDNRGFGCINRLQVATGGAPFNNLMKDAHQKVMPEIDFAAHARSLGAQSEKVTNIEALEKALQRAKENEHTSVIVIETDPDRTTEAGGHWWDVAVPEVSQRKEVREARKEYDAALTRIRERESE
ncbi:MAG: 3D-(3,5/4)-trihydroxycyclohexane-1,2-dione acylhydrolase (decyclizing) [Hyphococcus sp.]|nr:MAG: 3D-(3,5/4)-trihydroxycyclohexane-1,2-dione acylhydrolase (decyclizing) [Marinicaulis sp.]